MSCYWKSLEVGATLDAQGVLHVVERQHMVFTGDWNGGERSFDLRPGQEVVLRGMTRIDPATGARREMREGSLGAVDRYSWFSDRVLRWRARLPDDPPFENTEIVYDIAYSFYGALVETGGRYALNHDFAFADRSGEIEDVVVTLRIDPAWRVDGPREQTFRGGRLPPGQGYVVRTQLEWSGEGQAALLRTSPRQSRLLLALAGVPLLLVVLLLASEWSRGRFAPLTPQAVSQPGWLEQNLLRHPAELIGAVWDRGVGSDEVAATIARLAGEGKLETRVDGEKELHMTLKVDRNTLGGHERALVDGFFFGGRSETSTSDVKRHYKSKGFNPASLIQPTLEAQAKELVGPSAHRKWLPLWLPTLIAFVWGVYVLWVAAPATAEGRLLRFLGILLPLIVLSGIASATAACLARPDRPRPLGRPLVPDPERADAPPCRRRRHRLPGRADPVERLRLRVQLRGTAGRHAPGSRALQQRDQPGPLARAGAGDRAAQAARLGAPLLPAGAGSAAARAARRVVPLRDRVRPRQGRAGLVQGPRRRVGQRLVDVHLVELALDVVIQQARRAARRPAGAEAAARLAEPAPPRRGRQPPAPSRPAWRLLRRPGARAAAVAVGEAAEAAAAVAAAEAGSGESEGSCSPKRSARPGRAAVG